MVKGELFIDRYAAYQRIQEQKQKIHEREERVEAARLAVIEERARVRQQVLVSLANTRPLKRDLVAELLTIVNAESQQDQQCFLRVLAAVRDFQIHPACAADILEALENTRQLLRVSIKYCAVAIGVLKQLALEHADATRERKQFTSLKENNSHYRKTTRKKRSGPLSLREQKKIVSACTRKKGKKLRKLTRAENDKASDWTW